MGRSPTVRIARRTSPDSRSSTCRHARTLCSGPPRLPSPAAVLRRSASSGPTRPWATDRDPRRLSDGPNRKSLRTIIAAHGQRGLIYEIFTYGRVEVEPENEERVLKGRLRREERGFMCPSSC